MAPKEYKLSPGDRLYARKYRLQEYRDARKYTLIGAMLGVIVILAAIAVESLLTGTNSGLAQVGLFILGLLVLGGFIVVFTLSVTIESIEASLEAVEARLREEDA